MVESKVVCTELICPRTRFLVAQQHVRLAVDAEGHSARIVSTRCRKPAHQFRSAYLVVGKVIERRTESHFARMVYGGRVCGSRRVVRRIYATRTGLVQAGKLHVQRASACRQSVYDATAHGRIDSIRQRSGSFYGFIPGIGL